MMGDALEMARWVFFFLFGFRLVERARFLLCRQHHPPRIHKLAYAIGRDVQQFLTQALQSEEGVFFFSSHSVFSVISSFLAIIHMLITLFPKPPSCSTLHILSPRFTCYPLPLPYVT